MIVLVLGCTGTAIAAEPVLSILHPVEGSSTGEQQPIFQGTSTDPSDSVTLEIHEGGPEGTLIQTATVPTPVELGPEQATWEVAPGSPLAPGEYTAVAEQTNIFSETGSTSVTFTIDTTPIVSMNSVSSPTNDPTPALSGAASNAVGDDSTVSVTIYEGGSVGGTIAAAGVVSRSGSSWEYTPAAPLAEGTYTAQATQEDEAGNVGKSLGVTFTVLTKLPVVSMNSVSSPTNDPTPRLSGGASDGEGDDATVSVTIYEGGSVGGTVAMGGVVSRSGSNWEYKPAAPLPEGTYTAQAAQEDEAGNVGKSLGVTFVVDTTPPAVSISVVASPTKSTRPTLTGGAGAAVGDDEAVDVAIYEGTSASGTPAVSGSATVTGSSWSYTPTTALHEATYTAQATQEDDAGNVGKSSAVTFTVLTKLPVVSMNAVSSPTNDPTPTLSGAASDGVVDGSTVSVTIYNGGSVGGSVAAAGVVSRSGANWEYTPATPLPEGTYTAHATQEDEAGAVGESGAVTFVVDTTPPSVSIGAVASPTKNTRPTLTGGAGVAAGDEEAVEVAIYEGASVSGTPAVSGPATVAGSTWSYTPAKSLAEGIYTAEAFQEDEAENVGESAPVTFTVLTRLPVVSITSPTGGATLHVTQPMFEGAATDGVNDPGSVRVKIYQGSSASGTPIEEVTQSEGGHWALSWSYELANGTYTALATEEDAAGNKGESSTVTFKIKSVLTLETSAFEKSGRSGLVAGPSPSFQGSASEASNTVTVSIYSGPAALEKPELVIPVTRSGTRWATGPVDTLAGGTYTVQAEQAGAVEEFQFTVDATPPQVTLTSPSNGSSTSSTSQTVSGVAGTEEGDIGRIATHLYAGSTPTGTALQTIGAEASSQTWSATFAGLEPGTYTAQAEQEDDVGNVGHSEPVTFTVLAPTVAKSPPPPAASFTWFPAAPHTGEAISLVSTSTDASTAIASFGWALAGNDVFSAGGSTIGTSFSTAGPHVVQLRVVDANGQSSVVSETIPVSTPVIPLMQPFPVVRIAGSFNSAGAKIGVLTVLAPVGATVRVTCRGGGCPAKPQSLRATAPAKSKASTVLVRFRRFERSLRPGVVLDVWVSDAGELGKFTRFVIRRDKAPTRTDLCLNPAGTIPLVCPAS